MTATAKWIWRARGIEKEIQALRDARQRTFDQLVRMTQNYESDGAQNTKDPHKYDKLSELNDLIDRKETALMNARYEITEVILQVPSGNQRSVLLKYFVGGKTLEEIAVENGCSARNVQNVRKRGLSWIEKNFPEVP